MVNISAFVTVRNSSTRLPNKAIMPVYGKIKSIETVILRAQKTGFQTIICTSYDQTDHVFEEIAQKNEVQIFRGNLFNKIIRWYDCFEKYNTEYALLVDGDDLLYDYDIAKRAIDLLITSGADMVKNPDNVVCGYFTYAISKKGITKLYEAAKLFPDTDVITEFIKKGELDVKYIDLFDWEKDHNFRLTLDYPEDLEMFKTTFEQISYLASGKEVTEFYKNNPEVVEINWFRQNEFLDNQKKFNENISKK